MIRALRRNYAILKTGLKEIERATLKRHLIFFVLTLFTMFLSGLALSSYLTSAERYRDAIIFTLAMTVILLGYSLTRYVQARAYGLYANLPLFIPMPLFSPFGTLGVVTQTPNKGVNSRALFDVAFWPPVVCFSLSVLSVIAGVLLSSVIPGMPPFEDPLIVKGIIKLFKDIPQGYMLSMHPLYSAGWAGLLFTAFNLFPLGPLSGSQIIYTLLGIRQREVAYIFMSLLFMIALWYPLWFGAVLLFVYMGVPHPELRQHYYDPQVDMIQIAPRQPLDRRRQWTSLLCAFIFLASFTPYPFQDAVNNFGKETPRQILPPGPGGDRLQPQTPPPATEDADDFSI